MTWQTDDLLERPSRSTVNSNGGDHDVTISEQKDDLRKRGRVVSFLRLEQVPLIHILVEQPVEVPDGACIMGTLSEWEAGIKIGAAPPKVVEFERQFRSDNLTPS